jgi:hypothetical protein
VCGGRLAAKHGGLFFAALLDVCGRSDVGLGGDVGGKDVCGVLAGVMR